MRFLRFCIRVYCTCVFVTLAKKSENIHLTFYIVARKAARGVRTRPKSRISRAFRYDEMLESRAPVIKIARITVSSSLARLEPRACLGGDCVRDTHARTHELVSCRFTRSLARSLACYEECACRKGTNSQVSADDSRPAVRAVVAKPGRGTNGFCVGVPFRGKIAAVVRIKCI